MHDALDLVLFALGNDLFVLKPPSENIASLCLSKILLSKTKNKIISTRLLAKMDLGRV